jgi:hypothetical protein
LTAAAKFLSISSEFIHPQPTIKMINLRNFFEIAFDAPDISDDKLRKFSEVHLRKLTANNGDHSLDSLVADTTAAHTSFFGAITDEDTHTAVRQGLTQAMNKAIADFKERVSRREGMIRDVWGKAAPEYLEFFPQGLSEYSGATLANVETLMTRMVNASTAHKDQLGQAFVDVFVGLKKAYVDARTAQLDKQAAVLGSKTEAAEGRAALERQLMVNVLTLALKFLGDPDRGLDFFDQSIIRSPQATPAAEPTPATPTP